VHPCTRLARRRFATSQPTTITSVRPICLAVAVIELRVRAAVCVVIQGPQA
jgi:hypothetical protein